MSFLGASTKTYRSYGKRKNNTTNKGAYALWDSSPEATNRTNLLANNSAPTAPHRSLNSPSSSSSTSSSSDEDSPPPKASRTQALAATKPPVAARKKPAAAATDKENNSSSSPFEGSARRPVFNKAKSRIVLHSPVKSRRGKTASKAQEWSAEDDSDAPKPKPTQRVPLKPRFEIVVPPSKKPSPLREEVKQPKSSEDEESGDESEEPVVRPSRRRGTTAKVQESSEEGDNAFEVVVEVPVKSARSSRRSSKSRASVDSVVVEEPVRLSLRSRARKVAAEDVEEEEEDELEESSGPTLEDPEDEEEEEEDQLASSSSDELESEGEEDPLSAVNPSSHSFPSLLEPLLVATSQTHPLDFTSLITSPPSPFSPPTSISRAASRWTKIGEASYSEVFEREGIVVKIIPVAGKENYQLEEEEREEENEVPYSSDWASVEREIEISKLVGGEGSEVEGFAEFKGAFIVQGRYPAALLSQWDAYKFSQTPQSDDQIRPDVLPADQVYAIVCLSHAGSDLEGYKLRSWTEATSVLWQVATICAEAEERLEFEHRDLHWGNVLVQPVPSPISSSSRPSALASLSLSTPPRKSKSPTSTTTSTLSTSALAPSSSGVQVTLIDFTLSRARVPGGEEEESDRIVFDGFEDECVFEGEGDHQFDVYRAMRRHIEATEEEEGGWEGFHPLTNVMWLHYLSLKLLHSKGLKPPPPPSLSSPAPSSPFKPSRPSTRRASALPAASRSALVEGGAGAGKRKARTLPAKLADEARLRNERAAWEMLKRVERALGEAVGVVEKGKVKKGGRKVGRKEVDMGAVRLGSAEEVVGWWKTLSGEQ